MRFRKRSKLSKKASRRNFRKGSRVKGRNMITGSPMRGGIRL